MSVSARDRVYLLRAPHTQVLDYEGRGGVTVITQATENTISYLLMRNATPADSGTYSCTPSNGHRATAAVHVLNGEPQAGQQQSACQAAGPQRAAATLRGTQGVTISRLCCVFIVIFMCSSLSLSNRLFCIE